MPKVFDGLHGNSKGDIMNRVHLMKERTYGVDHLY
jgi:hypothetical protein